MANPTKKRKQTKAKVKFVPLNVEVMAYVKEEQEARRQLEYTHVLTGTTF